MTPVEQTPSIVVLDTDVASFIFKGDTRGQSYQQLLVGQNPLISFMTLAELTLWTDVAGWGRAKRERLKLFLNDLPVHYADEELCGRWSTVTAVARRAGRRIEAADAWIAATALLYEAPLMTHNADDFAGVPNLRIINWSGKQAVPERPSRGG